MKSTFSREDKDSFEYALGIDNLTIKEMHEIMYILGKRKNQYGGYFKRDKDSAYHSILDNVDGSRDIVLSYIMKFRDDDNDDNDETPSNNELYFSDDETDFTDMEEVSDYLIRKYQED